MIMAVPDYQSFMLPLLKFAADGREPNQKEAKDALSRHFNITESDRREMPPARGRPDLRAAHLYSLIIWWLSYWWPWAMAPLAKTQVRWARWWDTTLPVDE